MNIIHKFAYFLFGVVQSTEEFKEYKRQQDRKHCCKDIRLLNLYIQKVSK